VRPLCGTFGPKSRCTRRWKRSTQSLVSVFTGLEALFSPLETSTQYTNMDYTHQNYKQAANIYRQYHHLHRQHQSRRSLKTPSRGLCNTQTMISDNNQCRRFAGYNTNWRSWKKWSTRVWEDWVSRICRHPLPQRCRPEHLRNH
jgi:hypothetical protein